VIGWFRRPGVTLLMVCTANVCRSPAAQVLLQGAFRARGLHRLIRVHSAGTAVAAPGARPDPRMADLGSELGLSFRGISAKPLTVSDLEHADAIYVMEPEHLSALEALAPGSTGGRATLLDPRGAPIQDPYFGSKADVRLAFDQIAESVEHRAEEWALRLNS
jgi:protein-tyrosine phosphatase